MKRFIQLLVIGFFLVALSATPVIAGKKNDTKPTTCITSGVHDGVVDQYQCSYNGGLSARTSYANSLWQSFTAGKTGELTEIDLGFFNFINGYGKVEIYLGEGIKGTIMGSKIVAVSCPGDNCMVPFFLSVPVTSGQKYTFRFIPGYRMSDPYGVQVGTHNAYSRGVLAYDVLGYSTVTEFDAVFATYVK